MDRITELLKAFNEDRLTAADAEELEKMIHAGLVQPDDLAIYDETMLHLQSEENLTISRESDNHFYKILNEEKNISKGVFQVPRILKNWSVGFSLGFASVAFLIGYHINSYQAGLPQQQSADILTQLIATNDVTERIHIASSISTMGLDKKITEALLLSLISDESANVRLASLNALQNYAHYPEVRSGLIRAISHQNSPVVLSQLAEAIQASGKPMQPEEFKKRLDHELPPPVLESLVDVLPTL